MSRVIDADFDAAARRLFRWSVQRSGLFRVRPTHEVVELGAEVTLGLGPWNFRCRVVDVFYEDGRCGFTYGTLPGHLERGEETFTLERLRDGRTLFLIDGRLRALPPLPAPPRGRAEAPAYQPAISPRAGLSGNNSCSRLAFKLSVPPFCGAHQELNIRSCWERQRLRTAVGSLTSSTCGSLTKGAAFLPHQVRRTSLPLRHPQWIERMPSVFRSKSRLLIRRRPFNPKQTWI
nr:DUF1990 domain-containing protein [uncultured Corynebacterium sp.]